MPPQAPTFTCPTIVQTSISSEHSSAANAAPLLASQAAIKVALLPSAHSRIKSCASDSIAGSVVSISVIVRTQLLSLLQSSVAVKVIVCTPVSPQASANTEPKSLSIVTSEHRSEPLAPFNQFSITASLIETLHSKVILAGQSRTGSIVSSMMNSASVVFELPQSSVAVKKTNVADPPSQASARGLVKLCVHITVLQTSEATAPPALFNQAVSASLFPLPEHSTLNVAAGVSMTGGVVSSIENSATQVVLFPKSSTIVNS